MLLGVAALDIGLSGLFHVTWNKRFFGGSCGRLLDIRGKTISGSVLMLLVTRNKRFLGVRFCVRWTTFLYMIGSKKGVSGAPFGGRGVGSPFLVYPPPPPWVRVFWGGLTGRFFLVTWNK